MDLKFTLAFLLTGLFASAAFSQPIAPPAETPNLPAIEAIPLTIVRFDPTQLAIKRVESRWILTAGKQFLKDFGPMEREAREAMRLIRDLNFTQYGMIAGASPPFEFWLGEDGGGQQGGLIVKNVMPFNNKTLRVEQTVGAWIIRDDKIILYNFGKDEAAAKQAFAVMKKHGFNQLGVIGSPRPVMTYLTVDPYARVNQNETKVDPREAINALSQQGLVLPNVGYVGGKLALDNRKLDLVRYQNEWCITHGQEMIGRFGMQESRAREALRLLQDARVTELVVVGKIGFPIFLSSGKAPRSVVLGINTVRFNPSQLRVQTINGAFCITENVRTLLTFGDNRTDAELVLRVIQHFQFDQIITAGEPERGGLRLFTKSK